MSSEYDLPPAADRSTSNETAPLDLTPQDRAQARTGTRSVRNWLIMGALGLVAGVVLFQALTSARVFFLNVDEAVERRETLGDDVFRMQGTVISEPETEPGGALLFTLAFGGEEAQIRHIGDEPSNLFRLNEQVIAEGRWTGQQFESSQILVKHSEEYVEENPERVDYELEETVPDVG
jgi:cytochrome c-type biogenesis protein CcmE